MLIQKINKIDSTTNQKSQYTVNKSLSQFIGTLTVKFYKINSKTESKHRKRDQIR